MTTDITRLRELHDAGAFINRTDGKSNIESAGYKTRQRPEWNAIEKHLSKGGTRGVGVHGNLSGYVLLDLDMKDGHNGRGSLEALEDEFGALPLCPRDATPNGGNHFILKAPLGLELGDAKGFRDGLDMKCSGYVVIPPSPGYTWEVAPGEVEIPEAPMWLLEVAGVIREPAPVAAPAGEKTATHSLVYTDLQWKRHTANAPYALRYGARDVATAPEGDRNTLLNDKTLSIFSYVGHGLLDADECIATMREAGLACGLPERDVMATIQSAMKKGLVSPLPRLAERKNEHSRAGNGSARKQAAGDIPVTGFQTYSQLETAEILNARHGEDISHHSGRGYLHWNGKIHEPNEKAIRRLVTKIAKDIHRAAVEQFAQSEDNQRATALKRWAKETGSKRGIDGVLGVAEALEGIDADHIEFDDHPNLLTVRNGTLDLSTGTLREHRREDYITRACPWPYDPKATCSRWLESLYQWMDGSDDLVDYLQWFCGYSLTGSMIHHVFPIAYGQKRTGKSTFIRAMQALLGPELSHRADVEIFLEQRQTQHSTDKAALMGKRFVCAVETNGGRRLDESFVKQITGGDNVRARFMRQDSFEFTPQCKILLATNDRPVIRDDSGAVFARLRMLPFDVCFLGRENKHLDDELLAEMPGILRWAVEGAKRALVEEPPVPARVQAGVEQYRRDSDNLAQFISEECTEGEYETVEKSLFYNKYIEFSGNRNETKKALSDRMQRKGYIEGRRHGGIRVWKGLSLNYDMTKAYEDVDGER